MPSEARSHEELSAENERLRQRVMELETGRHADQRMIEAFYRGLANSPTYLVVRVDAKGHFTFVNDLYCETFGKCREELIGQAFMPLVHEEDLPATLAAMQRLEVPPFRTNVEQRAMTVRGFRWFLWEDWAIKDENGVTIEIQAVGRDITDYFLQGRALEEHRATVQELSTPLMPIADGVIVMPLIGTIDEDRARLILESLLLGVSQHRADAVILDVTGVKTVTTLTATMLVRAAQAVRLLGAHPILTGVGPVIARSLVELGVDLGGIMTRSTLQMGIAHALHARGSLAARSVKAHRGLPLPEPQDAQ